MKEKEFMQTVLDYARLMGWHCYHTHNSRRSEPGFPDLVMVRDDELIFAELKSPKGRTTAAQDKWMVALYKIKGAFVYTWRPHDMDFILARLKKKPYCFP